MVAGRKSWSQGELYGEADLEADELGPIDERCSYPPRRARRESDVFALTVPPGEHPAEHVPGSIAEAVRQAAEQVPTTAQPAPDPAPEARDDGGDDAPDASDRRARQVRGLQRVRRRR